jgi:hypothetical protein
VGRWARLLGLLLAMGLLLVGCNRSGSTPTPAPLTPVLPIVTSVNAPVGTLTNTVAASLASTLEAAASPPSPTSIASQGAFFTSPRYSYTVTLPCCWLALPTPGTAIESALAEMEAENNAPIFGDLTDRLRGQKTGAVLELIALLPDDENVATPVAQMTVSVLPTHGLTLDGYLAATEAELNSIANTTVVTAQIEPTLGVEGLPAVVIEYTAGNVAVSPTPPAATPAVDLDADSDGVVAGLQVAFFGESPDYLIVLTFTATTERYAELQPEFLHIVRTITLGDPAV